MVIVETKGVWLVKKRRNNHGDFTALDEYGRINGDNEPGYQKRPDYDVKDIIAMIIAAFELVFPPVFMIFGFIALLYFVLRFVSGF